MLTACHKVILAMKTKTTRILIVAQNLTARKVSLKVDARESQEIEEGALRFKYTPYLLLPLRHGFVMSSVPSQE